jgi:hypothetical protein
MRKQCLYLLRVFVCGTCCCVARKIKQKYGLKTLRHGADDRQMHHIFTHRPALSTLRCRFSCAYLYLCFLPSLSCTLSASLTSETFLLLHFPHSASPSLELSPPLSRCLSLSQLHAGAHGRHEAFAGRRECARAGRVRARNSGGQYTRARGRGAVGKHKGRAGGGGLARDGKRF